MDSILGALFAVMIGLMVTVPTVGYMHHGQVSVKEADTAAEMKVIDNAAEQYIQANYAAVEASATASSPATITVPMLEATGYLSSAVASENPYLQNWQVQVLQPTAGNLQALVMSTGGNTIPADEATAIAAQVGQEGGFLPYSGEFGAGTGPGNAIGSYGNWGLPMTNYTNPGQGHLVALLAFNNGNLENDYLYRVAVPGQPQLNTMATNLGMGGNTIENVAQNTGGVGPGNNPATVNGIPNGIQFGNGASAAALSEGAGGNMAVYAPGGNLFVYGSQSGGNYANGNINGQNITAGPANGQCIPDANNHCAGQVSAAGLTEANLPANWWGGLISRDIYSVDGTIAVGPSGDGYPMAFMSDRANGNIESGGSLTLHSSDDSTSMVVNAAPGGSGGGGAVWLNSLPLIMGRTPSGACDSGSRVWLSSSSIGDGCDGNIYELPSGGANGAIVTNGSFMPGFIASAGATCPRNGLIADNQNGSGQLMECSNSIWRPVGGGFSNTFQMSVNANQLYKNTTGSPEFISSYCSATPYNVAFSSEQVELVAINPSGTPVSQSTSLVAEGNGNANMSEIPSASIMIPAGYYLDVVEGSNHGMSCSVSVAY